MPTLGLVTVMVTGWLIPWIGQNDLENPRNLRVVCREAAMQATGDAEWLFEPTVQEDIIAQVRRQLPEACKKC
jgi:hypothetical protein